MKRSLLRDYARHLRRTVETFAVLNDARIVPTPGSPAEKELAEGRDLIVGDGPREDDPIRNAYAAASMSYTAALDEALGMSAAIIGGTTTAIPAVVLTRALAETASQAWWLLGPVTGARERVERLQCFRLRSAIEGEKAAQADGIPAEEWHEWTETQAQVLEYSRKFGLGNPRRDGYAYQCGSQRMRSVSYRIAEMFKDVDVGAAYNIHSGFAHGELFALWQGFERSPDGRLQKPVINDQTLVGAVAVAARALYCPAKHIVELFGLDPAPGTGEWIGEHNALTQETDGADARAMMEPPASA